MKKRLISGLLAAVMILGMALSSLSTAFAAERVYHSWKIADDILGAIQRTDGADDETVIDWGDFKWQKNYYGSTGFKSVTYATDTYSYIVGANANNPWMTQLEIRNHRGYGKDSSDVDYQADGVTVFCASTDVQKLTFTAPIHGKFNFVPLAIGGGSKVDNSLFVGNGGWTVEVLVKGVAQEFSEGVTTLTLAKGEYADLMALNDIELKKGETISVVLTPTASNFDSNAGNNITVNLRVDLTDEIPDQVLLTDVETASINVVKAMAATSATETVFTHPLIQYGYKSGATSVYTDISNFGISKHTLVSDGYTRFYNEWSNDNSNETSVYDAPEKNNIIFRTKNAGVAAIKITADKQGKFTLSAASLVPNQVDGFLKVVTPDGETVVTSNTDGFSVTANLKAGESMYLVASRNAQNNWNLMSFNVKDLNLDIVYTPVKITPPVYNTTEYDVAEELLKNDCGWTTAYQAASNVNFSGFLKAASALSNGTAPYEAGVKAYSDGLGCSFQYSGSGAGYIDCMLYVETDGSIRYRDDYVNYLIGFQFTAANDASYVLTSDPFTVSGEMKGGSTAQVGFYKLSDDGTALTLVGTKQNYTEGLSINLSVDAKAGETYYVLFGRSSVGAWNQKKDLTTESMTLTENILVTPGSVEELPLEYGDDPNYEYKYEIEDIKISTSSAEAEAGEEVEVKLTVDQCYFGYSGFTIKVPYDADKLSVVSVTAGSAITAFAVDPVLDGNPLVLTFAQAENVVGEGEIAVIEFKIKDDAEGSATILPVVETMVRSNINGTTGGITYVTENVTVTPGTVTVDPGCEHNVDGVEWTHESDGDCQTKGTEVKLCTICGKVAERQDTVFGDHDVEGVEWTHESDGDCQTMGTEVKKCTICGEVAVRQDTTIGNHNIEGADWEHETDGDCQTMGTEVKRCTVCGQIVDRQDTVFGDHDVEGVEWTPESEGDCCTKGTEVKLCTLCGEVAERQDTVFGDHDWNDWVITTNPDWDTEGEKERTCKLNPDHNETDVVPVGIVESVTVKTPPTTTTYQKDGSFDATGLVVEVTYSNYDFVTTVTDFTGVTFDYDFSEAGEKEVKFTVAGEELTVDVEVVAGILGDVNGSGGTPDTADAIAILRAYAGYTDAGYNAALADYNNDGFIDTGDAIAILRLVAGY